MRAYVCAYGDSIVVRIFIAFSHIDDTRDKSFRDRNGKGNNKIAVLNSMAAFECRRHSDDACEATLSIYKLYNSGHELTHSMHFAGEKKFVCGYRYPFRRSLHLRRLLIIKIKLKVQSPFMANNILGCCALCQQCDYGRFGHR